MAQVPSQPCKQEASLPLPHWMYIALAAAIVAVYWLPRLSRGFWVDEAGAYWIAHNGFGQVWHQMQIYPGQSFIYAHVTSLVPTSGLHKEIWLRLPSVAGALVASWLLFKLTEQMVGPRSGFLAVILFCCAGAIVETATNARPYALGLAVIMASFWSLREWVHTQRRWPLVVYSFCSPLVVYFHYVFGLIFLVQLLYLAMASRAGRRFSWLPVLGAGGLILAGGLPLAWQLLTVVRQAGMWKTATLPSISTFVSFYPLQTFSVTFIGLVLFRLLYPYWFRNLRGLARDDLFLLILWLLLGPVIILAGVRVTGYALFATRYLIYALLPAFVLLAWAIRQVDNERARFALVATVAVNAALYIPGMRDSEWRTPLAVVRQSVDADTPLLLRSGFVESATLKLRGEPKASSYLFAPLAAYPVPNEIIPVPFFVDRFAEQTIEDQVREREQSHRRFCLMASSGSDVFELLPAWFRSHGYRSRVREVSGFTIMLFERPG